MIRVKAVLGAIAVLAAVSVAGCVGAPILNVSDAPVTTAQGKPATKEEVRQAIMRAGAGLGWQFRDETQDRLVGTLVLRTHTAVVEVPYSAERYSIRYRSSINLGEAEGLIHKNYNGWIQNLHRNINAQLGTL